MTSEKFIRSQDTSNDKGRLTKISESIANGEIPIPVDWPDDQLHPLLDLVHAARRRRLVRFLARLVARDICRRDRKEQGTTNVTT